MCATFVPGTPLERVKCLLAPRSLAIWNAMAKMTWTMSKSPSFITTLAEADPRRSSGLDPEEAPPYDAGCQGVALVCQLHLTATCVMRFALLAIFKIGKKVMSGRSGSGW